MGSEGVTVRRGRVEDAGVIADFNARMAMETEGVKLDEATVLAGVRAAIADEHKGMYFVAEIGGEVAGQLMITHEWSDWRNADIWWIQSVYVSPGQRKKGVFKAMFAEVEREAERAGAVGIRLYVEKENAVGQGTYRALGMEMTHYLVMKKMREKN